MKIIELINEGYKFVFGRNKHGLVRRYRCTDGPKKGRIVAKPATCSTSVSLKKSATAKKTRRTKGLIQDIKRSYRFKRPTTQRLIKINRNIAPTRKKIR